MPTKTKKPRQKAESDSAPFSQALGLREDGGWVDVLKQEWVSAPANLRSRWEELIALCHEARPRCGQPWLDAENAVLFKIDPPLEGDDADDDEVDVDGKPLFEPAADPGTDAYQQALERVAPDETWLGKVRALLAEAGGAGFISKLGHLYQRAVNSGIGSLNRNGPNKDILRGLIWCAAATPEAELIEGLRQLAIWSLEHNTAQAKTIGIVLTFIPSEHAAAALRMIEVAVKRASRKERFGRYASHVEKRIGLSPEDSAERFVPTFELDAAGRRKFIFGEDGSAELFIESGKAATRYFNAAGKEIAAPSAAIKRNHAEALEELRMAAKSLGQLLSTQRDRLELLFLTQKSWDYATWRARYMDHPVVGSLARRLLWQLDDQAVLFSDCVAAQDQALDTLKGGHQTKGALLGVHPLGCPSFPPSAKVSFWHPLGQSAEDVLAWRNRLESVGITQPFKQAHREIYILTEAERRTANYSNRFAGHILRQSQFRALASARGWQSQLLGDWDGGDKGVAQRDLPGEWRAEFWLYAAASGELEAHFQSRGLPVIATDQVRFYRAQNSEPSPLEEVPAILFSEAMRDVDLFVAVTSVGNNPTWSDGGPRGRYRDYWQTFNFGDLSTSARTRRGVLERLVPKLKIAAQCRLEEKFLVVTGTLRTYKIHLGSGSILMQPNNQYLCIVPDQRTAFKRTEVFLPFEGDSILSAILSKAFLLAEDNAIKDKSIISQIRGE
jgi:hypothetical protein